MHVSQEQQYLTMTPLTKTGGLPFTFDIEDSLSDDIRHAPPPNADATDQYSSETSLEMGSIELEHDDSNVIPYAIMANWSALSKLSEELCSAVYHAAMSAEKRSTATRPGMSATALSRFIHVWEKVAADAAHPFFSVSPKGYIVAEWHNDPNNNLTLMFDGKGTVFYALFDADAPCEGFAENDAQYKNTINMFLSRTPNPFKW